MYKIKYIFKSAITIVVLFFVLFSYSAVSFAADTAYVWSNQSEKLETTQTSAAINNGIITLNGRENSV